MNRSNCTVRDMLRPGSGGFDRIYMRINLGTSDIFLATATLVSRSGWPLMSRPSTMPLAHDLSFAAILWVMTMDLPVSRNKDRILLWALWAMCCDEDSVKTLSAW